MEWKIMIKQDERSKEKALKEEKLNNQRQSQILSKKIGALLIQRSMFKAKETSSNIQQQMEDAQLQVEVLSSEVQRFLI